ncbi:MAG: energy-coupling factor ABC transporter ATP-binding protein [Thermoplasmata archaeon]
MGGSLLRQTDPIVSLRDVHYVYPNGVEALRGIDLNLYEGEMVGLLGENGSGKTTLARVLVGLLRPTKGSVSVFGLDAAAASAYELVKHVGLVFQNPDHQIFEKTVWDEVAFGPRNYRMSQEEVERRVEGKLRDFELSGYASRLPTSLSGGERKRVAFASTFALEPNVLLLDEPTKGMDYGRKRRLAQIAGDLSDAGKTVVFITHDVEFAYESTQRTIVLHRGRVVFDGDTREILSNPQIEEAGLKLPPMARLAILLQDLGLPQPIGSVEEFCNHLEVLL